MKEPPKLPRPSRTLPAQSSASRPSRAQQIPPGVAEPGTAEEAAAELEKAQAILDVVQHSARFTRAVSIAKPIESYLLRPIILATIAALMVTVTTVSYLTRAEWVFGASTVPPSIDRADGYHRFAMYLLAHRVNDFRSRSNGQLPASLDMLGEYWTGIEYAPVDLRGGGVYELRSQVGDRTITYRSNQDVYAFLGGSERFLRDRYK